MKNVCKYGQVIAAILYGGKGTASQDVLNQDQQVYKPSLQMMLWPKTEAQDLHTKVYSQAPLYHIDTSDQHIRVAEEALGVVEVQPYTFSYKPPQLIQKRKRVSDRVSSVRARKRILETISNLSFVPNQKRTLTQALSRVSHVQHKLKEVVAWGRAIEAITDKGSIQRYEECLSTKFGRESSTIEGCDSYSDQCNDMILRGVGTIKAALPLIYDGRHDEFQKIGSSFFLSLSHPTGNTAADRAYFLKKIVDKEEMTSRREFLRKRKRDKKEMMNRGERKNA
jgi:hypothetical protein